MTSIIHQMEKDWMNVITTVCFFRPSTSLMVYGLLMKSFPWMTFIKPWMTFIKASKGVPEKTFWWTRKDLLVDPKRPSGGPEKTFWWTRKDLLVDPKRPSGGPEKTFWWTRKDLLVDPSHINVLMWHRMPHYPNTWTWCRNFASLSPPVGFLQCLWTDLGSTRRSFLVI